MEKKKMTVYKFDDVTVELVPETKVKIKVQHEEEKQEGEAA